MNIEKKYIVLVLKTLNREHVLVNSFSLEYFDDYLLHEIKDLLVQPKFKTFSELDAKYPSKYPDPLWEDNHHLFDEFDDILELVWDNDFYKLKDEEILKKFKEIKKKVKERISRIEKIIKKKAKERISRIEKIMEK